MVDIKAYDDMMAALLKFYRSISETSEEMSQQVKAMRDVMNDDYADELCDHMARFYERFEIYCEDIQAVYKALDERMTQIFTR